MREGSPQQGTSVGAKPATSPEFEPLSVNKKVIAGKDLADTLRTCCVGPAPPNEDLRRDVLAE